MRKFLIGVLALIVLIVAGIAFWGYAPDIPRDELVAKYGAGPSQFLALEDGARAHIRDQGNPQGPPLVLVHGSNASLHTWEPWVEELGDTYRLVTLDLPAHGLTGAVPADDYSVGGMVRFVDAVAGELGLERFALGGNSMGGSVALNYALAHPQKIEALILVDAGGIARTEDETSSGSASIAFTLSRTPVVRDVMRVIAPRGLFEDATRSVFVDQARVDDAMIDRYWKLNRMEGTREATMKRFATPYEPVPHEAVRTLDIPTLVMWGDEDNLIPVSVGERFHDLLPRSTLVIYEDVGHIPMEEVPEKSARDVRAFLKANGMG